MENHEIRKIILDGLSGEALTAAQKYLEQSKVTTSNESSPNLLSLSERDVTTSLPDTTRLLQIRKAS